MIEISNGFFSYEDNIIFQELNLEINKGEIIVIIGLNGSGKTTLAHLIGGIHYLKKGILKVDDITIDKKTSMKHLRQKLGIVFQDPNCSILFNTVYDDIYFTLKNLNFGETEIKNKIKEALTKVGMLDFINRNPHELSLGQKQRIAIANAIATNPDYLVLDEVTSMLDSTMKQEIYSLIKQIKKDNKTIIMTTNFLEEIVLADRVVILENDKVNILKNNEILNNLENLEKKGFYIPLALNILKMLNDKNHKIHNMSNIGILDKLNEIV